MEASFTLSDQIRALHNAGLTMPEIAKGIGVPLRTLENWTYKGTKPSRLAMPTIRKEIIRLEMTRQEKTEREPPDMPP